ncbi:hypothetical protein J6590_090821 [Homalodisca vitripennis]|nr:hypothetical protein J6590_005107 [Homalodisca vitripennis]KAG8329248.1 hypothetical protein J6590_090821 [Homalodisca vitripennis]
MSTTCFGTNTGWGGGCQTNMKKVRLPHTLDTTDHDYRTHSTRPIMTTAHTRHDRS